MTAPDQGRVLKDFLEILKDLWNWRGQVTQLGLFDLRKQMRGAVLGWLWFFAKPAVYVGVFWFALEIGLKQATAMGSDAPYILWLMAGLMPWFHMQEMLGQGSDILHRYSYLVNKIKFPVAGIPAIYAVSTLVIQCGLVIALLIAYFLCGQPLDIHLLQLPLAMLVMVVFWYFFSLCTSMLSAISKDFKNLIKTLSTPLFLLSGIIFSVSGVDWLQRIMYFNPVTFIAEMYRGAVYSGTWFWEDPFACFGMLVVFLIMVVLTVLVYKRTKEEVHDVL